jgi:translocation and assembly module TamB
MVDDASSDPVPTPPGADVAPRPPRRRFWRWLGGTLAALVVVMLMLIGALLWALHSPYGTAWLLGWAPQLSVVAPKGALIGDFAAERVEIMIPGSGVIRLDAPSWRSLSAARGQGERWLHLRIVTLHADRLSWLAAADTAASSEPARAPRSLRLPIEVEIGAASVDELRLGAGDATPVQALRGRLHLGASGGARHRFDDLAAGYDRVRVAGSASIGADAPFPVTLDATLSAVDAALPWQAAIAADGPLEALAARAQVRVAAGAGRAAQALDAHAVVRPFATWPLGELQATTEALDLAAFTSAAPTTALSGRATVTTSGVDRPAIVALDLANARAGRWNEGRLPVTRLVGELRARPDAPDEIEVQTLSADLGSAERGGGRVFGHGSWSRERWTIVAELARVRPSALDARAADIALDGKVSLDGSGFAGAPRQGAVEVVAQLAGQLADRRLPKAAPRSARLRFEGTAALDAIDVRVAEASLGSARASLAGKLARAASDAPWQARGKIKLVEFDPAPWWPGSADSPFARHPSRLDAQGEFDLTLAATGLPLYDALAATRGRASLAIAPSTLAGVAVEGSASFVNSDGRARPAFDLVAAGNRARGQGQLAARGSSADDWQLAVDAPALDRLAPWLGADAARRANASGADTDRRAAAIAGSLTAKAHLEGRWPTLRTSGELHGAGLRSQALAVRRAEGRWQIGTQADAPLEATFALDGVNASGRVIERAGLRLSGSARAHRGELRIESAALPPEWADALAARAPAGAAPPATPADAAFTSAASAAPSPQTSRSAVVVVLEGGFVDAGGERNAGWQGSVRELLAQSLAAPSRTWLRARDLHGSVFWAGGPMRANIDAGSADVLGAAVRWRRIAWQGGQGASAGHLDAEASIEPLPVAPILRILQPDFGWGGDLAVGARIDVRSTPTTVVDIVVERAGGDLSVTDEVSTQPLGFTDLRLGIAASGGVWNFTAGIAGTSLGVASGAVVARTSASSPWPDPATPIEGVLELRVARLGAWGTWVPAGWRLDGELHASASFGGRVGAPTYTGRIEGSHLAVRNYVQGVHVSDGDVAIALQGTSARIERFTAKAGAGTARLEGDAAFDAAPVAHLTLSADKFEVLGRVDRKIVASGRAALRLDASTLALNGNFKVDEGLVDFTRSDAPTLGDDVEVVRRPVVAAAAAASAPAALPAPIAPVEPAARQVALDLRVDMGERLRIRGRGLDAGLRGELHLTSPNGRLAVNGSLRAVDGSYQAYGQKLVIDRGILAFTGPVENPRLDIEATRPDVDVRVGVLVTGTALSPRIRLFSEPDMSDLDKLSWLVVGRASESVGGADTALLQHAALALLSGEGPGASDRLTQAIGLDTISVRQGEGEAKDTIVSLGKQISKDWYVGYERGLNATAGSWQLIYRLARRFTVRAQAGADNAIDLNWTLRWR